MLWPDVSERLQRAPAFLGGMGQRLAEKQARDLGWTEITGALLEQLKSQMLGGLGRAAAGGTDTMHAAACGCGRALLALAGLCAGARLALWVCHSCPLPRSDGKGGDQVRLSTASTLPSAVESTLHCGLKASWSSSA
jgi:hypothetical protein